jgi:hypothetical protein
MRHFRLILFPLMALEAVGVLVMVLMAPLELDNTETIELPAGPDGIGHAVIDTHGGGSITGNFSTGSGRDVLVMLMDEDQYADFVAEESGDSLFSRVGASGEFSIDRPAMEWCHVVVLHADVTVSAERVTVSYTVHSMNWDIVLIATVLVFGPGFATALVIAKHSKDKKAALGPLSPYDDVVIFDEEPGK